MISDNRKECFVWIWLPEKTQPVVAGRVVLHDHNYLFTYGQSYLKRSDAIPIYDRELPLKTGVQEKTGGTDRLFGCIRDSSPDAWGRRVILNHKFGVKGKNADTGNLDEITYLLESGSDRIGALDFQVSPHEYIPRLSTQAKLEELMEMVERVERGIPLTPALALAMNHGTSIGGARPKVLIDGDEKKYIAKFSSSTDQYNVIKAEFVAMKLAEKCGLDVAPVSLKKLSGKDILLIERFDRTRQTDGWSRRLMLSALTLLGLDEMTARYASYELFAEEIRLRFRQPRQTLRELFGRMVFNILVSNTDDHARNHAAFWNGKEMVLTPAYDICPQLRMGGEASQAMLISGQNNSSRLEICLESAGSFMLGKNEARAIIDHQVDTILQTFNEVSDEARLSHIEKELFMKRLLLNPYAFQGYGNRYDFA